MPNEIEMMEDAVYEGNAMEVDRLLDRYPELLHYEGGAGTWIHVAASIGQKDVAQSLVRRGCDVNKSGTQGVRRTPLAIAVSRGFVEVAQLLLENGAEANKGEPLVSVAVNPGPQSLALAKLLVTHGADINVHYYHEQLNRKVTPLAMAELWDNKPVYEYLLSLGASMPEDGGEAPVGDDDREVIKYFDTHFGPSKPMAIIEIVQSEPPVAVHVIPPTSKHPCVTLFTTGMSAHPMTLPQSVKDAQPYQYAELFIQLPSHWPMSDVLEKPDHLWPILWLRSMARYPFQNATWLGGPVTVVTNGEPPEPLAKNVAFDSLLLLAERSFETADGRCVQLYRMFPLFPKERQLEANQSAATLLKEFDNANIDFIASPNRRCVAY